MKTRQKYSSIAISLVGLCLLFTSCSLEEYDPSGYNMESVARSSVEGYRTIINECNYGWQQRMYGCEYWMMMTEGGTDMWNYQKNGTSFDQYFKYKRGGAYPNNSFKDQFLAFYDGVGACNTAISLADLAPFKTEEEKNALMAEAHFLRANYYFQLVEQFGPMTIITKPAETVDLEPVRSEPLEVYKQVIIPDLEFAAKWLPIKNELSRPSRKTAMAYLALAYLQTVEYDNTKQYAPRALEVAKQLVDDCESGGAQFGTFMYPTFAEVFNTANNWDNKEALWAHRFVQGANPRNPEQLNENDALFNCSFTGFGALQTDYLGYGGRAGGKFMPTHYLLKNYIQDDGTLDPRFYHSFKTVWTANKAYTWTLANKITYDKSDTITVTTQVAIGDTAIVLVHPNDQDYKKWMARKRDVKFLVVDLNDVYANDTVRMRYLRQRDTLNVTNPFNGFYPSLSKHYSSHIYEVQANKKYGNLDATFMMRTPEVYLIAAEADIYVNGGANALTYINKIRSRAGAKPLTGTPTIQTILDERARELCGEYQRWNDLKRTGKLNYAYLNEKNPDVGQYFLDNKNTVKQIPLVFMQTLKDGGAYYQNPNY